MSDDPITRFRAALAERYGDAVRVDEGHDFAGYEVSRSVLSGDAVLTHTLRVCYASVERDPGGCADSLLVAFRAAMDPVSVEWKASPHVPGAPGEPVLREYLHEIAKLVLSEQELEQAFPYAELVARVRERCGP